MNLNIKKILISRYGFTLIELMIVVGIVGILAAIAIPNFSRYQSKSRQAEAKIALASVYGGEKAFYSEYSSYIADHAPVGYIPEGLKRFYSVGWSAANTATVTGYSGAVGGVPNYPMLNYPSAWTTCDVESIANLATAMGTNDPQTFDARAAGQIRDGAACDIWGIDELKDLRNLQISL